MNIAVFGLGYVGVVNLACLSSLGHKIYGCDIKSQKVDTIKKGKSPIFEPQVVQLIADGLDKGLIEVSTDAEEVVKDSEFALVCVGTPSRKDGTVNLDYTINTTIDIAKAVKKYDKKYTIVYRSTIPPGTIENFLIPELERELGTKMSNVKVAFLPEFLREGSAVNDFFHSSRIVIGTNEKSVKDLEEVFDYSENIPLVFTDLKTAEFVKYVDNAFHAVKIAFANEAYSIGAAYDVDIEKANEIFLMDKHLNISPYYLRPGLPFGGSCLPKDMRAINQLARNRGIETPMLDSILESNSKLQKRMLDKILNASLKKVMLYGLSFKSKTDDVRESPMLYLALDLIDAGIDLKIYDTDLNLVTLRIENANVVKYVVNNLQETIDNSELIVICKKEGTEVLEKTNSSHLIFNYIDNIKDYKSKSKMNYLYGDS
jgi:GDP-mannose 6-dehydrogenase